MAIGRFYTMIGALVRRSSDGRYLLLRRSEEKDFGAGTWECVTGRVDQGESFTQALHREVWEEIATRVEVDFIIGTTHFFRGPPVPENEIVGVQYCCTLENPAGMSLSWEHSESRWATVAEAEEMLPDDHWLPPVMRRAEAIQSVLPEVLLAQNRAEGFDLY